MRVLTVVRNFGQRGTQRVAENFSAAYARLEHDVRVLAFEHDGPRHGNYVEQGVEVLPAYATHPEEALRQVRTFEPELIHIHRSGVTNARETQLLAELKRPHNCVLETNVFSRFDPEADAFIDLHAQLTLAGLFRWQCLEGGRSRGVGFYLPNLLNYEVWAPPAPEAKARWRAQLDIPHDAVVLGTIGKTHPGLAQVVEEVIASERKSQVRVFWVAIESEETRGLIASLPKIVRTDCRLLPATAEDRTLAEYYSLFDLLLHWSANGESFGMVLAESIAVGTPVVMPLQLHRDIGGVEVIGHEEGGWIAGSSRRLAFVCRQAIAALPQLRQNVHRAQARHQQEYEMLAVASRALVAAQTTLARGVHRGQLAEALQQAGFKVFVDEDWMSELTSRRLGARSTFEALLFRGTHNALITDARRGVRALRLARRVRS